MTSPLDGALNALANSFGRKSQRKIMMYGLDGCGKTTILYKLKFGYLSIYEWFPKRGESDITLFVFVDREIVPRIPTIGFNIEEVEYKNISFTMWGMITSTSFPVLHCFDK